MAAVWMKGTHDFEGLDSVSKLRFGTYFGRFLRNRGGLYFHVVDKELEPRIWRGIQRAFRDLIIMPGSQPWWRTRRHWYGDPFQALVYGFIDKSEGETTFACYDAESLRDRPSGD